MRKTQLLLPISFFLLLFSFGIWHIYYPDRVASEMENRNLTTFSRDYSIEAILDGSRFREFEVYYSDQFVGRDEWLKGYRLLQMAARRPFIENYHASRGGWIVSIPFKAIPKENLTPSITAIKKFDDELKKEGIAFSFWSLPSKATYIRTPIPSFMSEDQGKANNALFLKLLQEAGIDSIKMYDEMVKAYPQDNPREWFFQTDHHWNMNGAFKGYQTIIRSFNERFRTVGQPFSKEELTPSCINNRTFEGSWNKQLYMLVKDHHDQICYEERQNPSFDKQFDIYLGNKKEENKVDRSEVFATGLEKDEQSISFALAYSFDYGEIHFVNKQPTSDLRVLILKDSYVNPIQYHLASHFKDTTIVDLRYFDKESLTEYVVNNRYDHVLMLYNDRNFDEQVYELE